MCFWIEECHYLFHPSFPPQKNPFLHFPFIPLPPPPFLVDKFYNQIGSHICGDEDGLCDAQTALRIADDDNIWKAGDAWLFQMSVNHRGPAHRDKTGGHRVVLVLSFAARPTTIVEDRRIPSLHTSWSLKMEMGGLSWYDLRTREYCPPTNVVCQIKKLFTWSGLRQHSLDWIQFSAIRIINDQFGFTKDYLEDQLKRYNLGDKLLELKKYKNIGPVRNWFMKLWLSIRKEIMGGKVPKNPLGTKREYEIGDHVETYVDEEWHGGTIQRKVDTDTYSILLDRDIYNEEPPTFDIGIQQLCEYGKCSMFTAFKAYVERCLSRFQEWSFEILQTLVLMYVIVALVTTMVYIVESLFDDEDVDGSIGMFLMDTFKRIFGSLIRVGVMSAPLLLFIGVWFYRMHTSQWAQDIVSGRIFNRPFLDPTTPSYWQIPKQFGPTIFPDEMDVLIPTRFDDHGYGSRNFHVDTSHPGNVLWNEKIESLTNGIAWNLGDGNSSFQVSVQEQIITQIHEEIRKQHGTFLLQNHEGNWIYLTDTEGRKYTRRRLIEKSSPMHATLGLTVRNLYSKLRHGRYRASAMYRLHTPFVVQQLEETIVYDEEPKKAGTATVFTTRPRLPKAVCATFSIRPAVLQLPTTVDGTVTPSKSAATFGRFDLRASNTKSNLEEGNSVVSFDGTNWMQGKIQKVHEPCPPNASYHYDVVFADGDETTLEGVPETLVRYYDNGMVVEGQIYEEPDDEPWVIVSKVKASGTTVEDEF